MIGQSTLDKTIQTPSHIRAPSVRSVSPWFNFRKIKNKFEIYDNI
jgi:hypothetical protein